MTTEKNRKRLPPYISHRTFRNFISRLQQQVPARIDRSYWGETLSGGTGTQLMAALRFLGLVDSAGKPSNRLRLLSSAKGEQYADLLREMASESYSFVFQSSLDLQNATYSQLEEAFHGAFQLTPDVCRKCIKFFISVAAEARMTLSPFMTKRLRSRYNITETRPVVKRKGAGTKRNLEIPLDSEKIPTEMSWGKMLLVKFPNFDPSWSDEVKLGWLEAFDGLKFPVFDPMWSDEVKLKWFSAFDKLQMRSLSVNEK